MWQLAESLWNDPGLAKWMGGGAEWPGIHTILVDPREGGETFEPCRRGLPRQNACHLFYRHCLVVGGDGRVLAIGSTTGSVGISGDGGDQ